MRVLKCKQKTGEKLIPSVYIIKAFNRFDILLYAKIKNIYIKKLHLFFYAACLLIVLASLALMITFSPLIVFFCRFGFCFILVALKECDLLLPLKGFLVVTFVAIILTPFRYLKILSLYFRFVN